MPPRKSAWVPVRGRPATVFLGLAVGEAALTAVCVPGTWAHSVPLTWMLSGSLYPRDCQEAGVPSVAPAYSSEPRL